MTYRLTTTKSWSETKNELVDCLRKWGVNGYELECDAKITTSWTQTTEQRRVKLRLQWKDGREIYWSYDLQERAVDNLRVLYLAADAMRMNEARGIDKLLQEAYMALPAPKTERDPWEVLGLRPGVGLAQIDAAYRTLAKELHPDKGGNEAAMAELNSAYERAKQEGGGS
jgi:DnaJ domain